ncbi:ribonuclease H-like domain-containing protein [Metabacillus sp. KIGAM252]|uniref:Ribonuclease H-like domain-containing protein n=1 Tax=Metabacillus flavus TaxID=2823519 RepID=A0ABS5LFH4_9BACI|nr:ribonuclease H-like domain-containing protein [Metabacillus flavus]MBS2969359.1 ribonuclease H-like domain-containing protein [Metabacillus flavus]
MSLKNKLNRLKNHIISETSPVKPVIPVKQETKAELNPAGLKPVKYGEDFCLLREISYPLDYQHGLYKLKDCADAVKRWNESSLNHPLSAKGHRPEDLFFFDTETTGLGGGTGNMIFLLGHASFSENEVTVRQHLLPKPGHEVALYKDFLKYVDITTLVTYNGKSFDWPQVKTRHTLIRDFVPELPSFGHFDLYHASRRLWKHKEYALKLMNVESEMLNIKREDDVPGYLAPIIYQHYVQTQDEAVLEGILKHNELDVLTLITLYTHLSNSLLNIGSGQTADEIEQYEVARWYETAGEHQTALKEYESIAKKGFNKSFDAKYKVAHKHKKEKNWPEAVMAWEEIAANDSGKLKIDASIQLAMYYEHAEKNNELALKWTESAIAYAKELNRLAKLKNIDSILSEGNKRKNRLNGKLLSNYSPGKRRK